MVIIIFILFLLTAALAYASKDIKVTRMIALVMGIINSLATLYFLSTPLLSGQVMNEGGLLRIDSFSAYMGVLITMLYLFTVVSSHRFIGEEVHEKIMDAAQTKLYFLLLPIFALAMLTVVMADNLGLLWLALEATTLASTPLVAIYKKDGSLEAAWKYIIICSLGISLGLLGVLMISYSGIQSGMEPINSLSLSMLTAGAAKLLPAIMQWAFLFAFIGLGTKVGFFPMHTWLPDAHGRTPSPISAMLSGVLLNVAFYCLMRIKFITDISLGSDQWTNNLFLIFGILSVVASAFYLYIQHHYKRMLAYSSMEHMGILAIAVGMGPIGIVPALMHMYAHALSKSLLFFGSGEILLRAKTGKIADVKNMIRKLPITGVLFIIGMFALLAAPPFATFASEILIMSAAVTKGHYIIFMILLAALSLVAVGLLKHTFNMFNIDHTEPSHAEVEHEKEKFNLTHLVMAVQICLLIVGGLFMLSQSGYNFFAEIAKSISY